MSGTVEMIIFVTFLSEYVLRVSCCTAFGENIYKFVVKPLNVIDLLSILPFFIEIIFDSGEDFAQLRVVRAIRLFRIIRIFKFTRYMHSINILF